jgi:tRNA/tmRNA/rRNA uracil-C5-methylase (TrmA/RlmC/RlmD family)
MNRRPWILASGGPAEGTLLELDVGSVAHGGQFVARTDEGQVVFVRHALPGERVVAAVTEERRDFLRADCVRVITASPDRVLPPCPYAGPDRCGGCDFQHASLAAQRELKAAVVREQLLRLGGVSPEEVESLGVTVAAPPDVAGQPEGLGWRTRVQYTVDSEGQPGLRRHRSHEVVRIDRCRIAHPRVQAAPVTQRPWPEIHSLEVVTSDSGDVTVLGRGGSGRRPEVVSGPAQVRERAVGREWTLPADAFWQVHPAAADTLGPAVVEMLEPRSGERAWDLYGGAGIFAAALAPRLAPGRVTVVEADRRLAEVARRCLKDLSNVAVVNSDVERALRNPRWRSVDLVVLDPPRAGAGRSVVEAVLARRPRAVAYVACDPAALARDVATFRRAGWRLQSLRGYDLFPMTHHVECVALLLGP